MGENKYAHLPPEVQASELVQIESVEEQIPIGPEGGGDGD